MSISIGHERPTFVIDTDKKLSGRTSNFTFQLDLRKGNKYDSCVLVSATIPKVWYVIEEDNNKFKLIENSVEKEIVIPIGNYNVYSFARILKNLLDNSGHTNGWEYFIEYPDFLLEPERIRYVYRVINNGGSQPSFDFRGYKYVPHEVMGFNFEYKDNNNPDWLYTFSGDQIESPNILSFQRTRYIQIRSSISNNDGNESSDIALLAASIPTFDTPDGSVIRYEVNHLEDGMKSLTNNNNNIFTFEIADDQGRPLNFRGNNLKFVIMCFQHNKYYELSLHALKIDTIQKAIDIETKERELQQLKKEFNQLNPPKII